MGVLQDIKLKLIQSVSDMLGKTRADQQYALTIFNETIRFLYRDGEMPLHGLSK
jgi:hypothetical protein